MVLVGTIRESLEAVDFTQFEHDVTPSRALLFGCVEVFQCCIIISQSFVGMSSVGEGSQVVRISSQDFLEAIQSGTIVPFLFKLQPFDI